MSTYSIIDERERNTAALLDKVRAAGFDMIVVNDSIEHLFALHPKVKFSPYVPQALMMKDPMSKVQAFLYLLGRDHLPLGIVEKLMLDIDKLGDKEAVFSNPQLASYARDVAQRLGQP